MRLGVGIISPPYLTGDMEGTVESVRSLPVDTIVIPLDNYQQFVAVVESDEPVDWWLCLYKKEILDSRFFTAIEAMMRADEVGAYRFYCLVKNEEKPASMINTRMFRKGVVVNPKHMQPLDITTKVVTILDGWIYGSGTAPNNN